MSRLTEVQRGQAIALLMQGQWQQQYINIKTIQSACNYKIKTYHAGKKQKGGCKRNPNRGPCGKCLAVTPFRTTIQSFHFSISAVQNQPSMRLKTSKKLLKYRNLNKVLLTYLLRFPLFKVNLNLL
jgi:hypothetical protein